MRASTDIDPKSFLYEERGAVAFITLNRPDRLNSLTFEVYRELSEALAALRSRAEVRVVVITGRGRGFCSGGDVEEIIGELFSRDMSGLLEFTRMTCDLIRAHEIAGVKHLRRLAEAHDLWKQESRAHVRARESDLYK